MTTSYYLAEETTESPLEETSTLPLQTKLMTSPVPLYGNETTELTSQSTSDVNVSEQMLTSTGKMNTFSNYSIVTTSETIIANENLSTATSINVETAFAMF